MLIEDHVVTIADASDGKAIERHLILWVSDKGEQVISLNLGTPKSWPVLRFAEIWQSDIEAGLVTSEGRQLPRRLLVEDEIPERHREIRQRRWDLIKDIVDLTPQVYLQPDRRELIGMTAKQKGVFRSTVVAALQRYWRQGRCANALLPDYDRCGGRDKRKASSEAKRGRPRKNGSRVGINITPDLAIKMERAGRTVFGARKSSKTIKDAYVAFIDTECFEHIKDPTTGAYTSVLKPKYDTCGVPTLEQFRYWADRPDLKVEYQRQRRGLHYQSNSRALLGTATSRTIGPGSRYEIDATIADIYLASEIDRAPICRPTVYFITDVFSRQIVAVTVTLEPPCWKSAMVALLTAAGDKVEYCKQYGVDITPEEWPVAGLPNILLHDGGELTSRWASTLINNFNVRFEKASAFRGDWKGLVESTFNVRARKITTDEPGSIPNEYQKIRGQDHRVKATYTLKEFTKIMIEDVLIFNNTHELKKYDADKDVLADSVPFVPNHLWHWGVANRCAPRKFPIDQVRAALLPHKKARITRNGINFRGAMYSCDLFEEKFKFDEASVTEGWFEDVHFDERYTDQVYLRHRIGTAVLFHKLHIIDRSRGYTDCSFWDFDHKQERAAGERADRLHENLAYQATRRQNIKATQREAKRIKAEMASDETASQTVKDIGKNTQAERRLELARAHPDAVSQPTEGSAPQTTARPAARPGQMPRMLLKNLRGM